MRQLLRNMRKMDIPFPDNSLDRFKVSIPAGKCGDWEVKPYTVTKQEEQFQLLRCMFNPQRPARYVPAGEYTCLLRGGTMVMSDTPDEIRDHLDAIEAASGHCLVGGLGLGMVTKAMLEKPGVTKVTVIELCPEVVKLVGEGLKAQYGDRLEILTGDLLEFMPSSDAFYGAVWLDIYDTISMDNLPEMTKLKRRFSRMSAWVGCWAEKECRKQKSRVKSGFLY